MSESPYTPPQVEVDTTYFTTEPCQASLAELFRMTVPNPINMLVAIFVRCFRIRTTPTHGFAFRSLHAIEFDSLPGPIRRQLESAVADLKSLGFRQVIAATTPILGNGQGYLIGFVGPDPIVAANVVYSELGTTTGIVRHQNVSFYSESASHGYATTNMKRQLNSPAFLQSQYHRSLNANRLFERHQERLAVLQNEVFEVFDGPAVWQVLQRNEDRIVDFQMERGVFRPMTSEEINAILRKQPQRPVPPAGPPRW